MAARVTDLFRMISARGPEPVYSRDPTKDVPKVDVVELLRPFTVDLAQVDPKIKNLVARIQVWSDKQLAQSGLATGGQANDRLA
ncbi:MAG TPA: hypothetical protein VF082_11815 [Jiangellaceae bacterium]